jgi:Organic solute transporter Ostalpha
MTFVAVIAQATDHYCIDSLSPAFAHVWVSVLDGTAVTVAMYCVIQYYIQLKDDIAEHRPFLKVLAIKGVIFFSFWQTVRLPSLPTYYVYPRCYLFPCS